MLAMLCAPHRARQSHAEGFCLLCGMLCIFVHMYEVQMYTCSTIMYWCSTSVIIANYSFFFYCPCFWHCVVLEARCSTCLILLKLFNELHVESFVESMLQYSLLCAKYRYWQMCKYHICYSCAHEPHPRVLWRPWKSLFHVKAQK